MKYTNNHNLPEPMFKALSNPEYVSVGDISVTKLIDSPRVRVLTKKHGEDVTVDVISQVWSLLGTAVHYIIDRYTNLKALDELRIKSSTYSAMFKMLTNDLYGSDWNTAHNSSADVRKLYTEYIVMQKQIKQMELETTGMVAEQRLLMPFGEQGKLLSGTPDLYEEATETLNDYKVTSVWKVIDISKKKRERPGIDFSVLNHTQEAFYAYDFDWRMQTNIYAYMLRQKGYKVSKIRIIAILKDWSAAAAEKDKFGNYPQQQVSIVEQPCLPDNVILDYINFRMNYHFKAEDAFNAGEELPGCSVRERWASPRKLAIMKPGRKSALMVLNAGNEADEKIAMETYIENCRTTPNLTIEERPEQDRRCIQYCSVNKHCSYFLNKFSDGEGWIEAGLKRDNGKPKT